MISVPALLAVLLAIVFWYAADVLLLVFAAVLLAVFLRGISDWVSNHSRVPSGWSIALTVLAIVVVAAGVIWLLAPRVADQIDHLSNTLPPLIREQADALRQYRWGRWVLSETQPSGDLAGGMGRFLARVGGFFSSTMGMIANLVLIVVVGLYLAAEAHRYKEGIVILFPSSKRTRVREVLAAIGVALRGWLLGQSVSMTFLGVCAYIGLSILGVPLALTLALLTSLFTLIPNLGPIIAVIPPALLALTKIHGALCMW